MHNKIHSLIHEQWIQLNIDSHQYRRIRFISFYFASALLLSSPFVINKQYVRSCFTCELRPFLTHRFVTEFHWCKRDQQIRNVYFPFLLRRIRYIMLWISLDRSEAFFSRCSIVLWTLQHDNNDFIFTDLVSSFHSFSNDNKHVVDIWTIFLTEIQNITSKSIEKSEFVQPTMAFPIVRTKLNKNLAIRLSPVISALRRYCVAQNAVAKSKVEYPPIVDNSKKMVAEREKLAWHEKVKNCPTIEEKLIKVNMPAYWGLRTTPLVNDEYHYNCFPYFQHWTRTQYEYGLPADWFKSSGDVIDDLVKNIRDQVMEAISFQYKGFR